MARAFTITMIVLVVLVLPAQLITMVKQQQENPVVYTAQAIKQQRSQDARVAGATSNKYELSVPSLNIYLDLDNDSDLLIAGGAVLIALACCSGLLLVFITRKEHPKHSDLASEAY